MTPVLACLGHADQLFAQQKPDQVTGGGLMNVHALCQSADSDARMIPDHVQGPDLCATQTNPSFDFLKMASHGVKYHAKAAQNLHRAGRIVNSVNGLRIGISTT